MMPRSPDAVVLNVLRWEKLRAWLIMMVVGGAGIAMTVISLIGTIGGDLQRLQGLAVALPLLGFATPAVRTVCRRRLVLVVDGNGFAFEQRPYGGFSVPWRELAGVRVLRDPKRTGLLALRGYHVELRPSGRRLAQELEYLREDRVYRYPLGHIGPAGRRVDEALRGFRPNICGTATIE